MVMSLALTISIALAPVVLGLVGYALDTRRGLFALLGTLMGAQLAEFWGARWGAALAGGLAGEPLRATFIMNCVIFIWGALLVGYGGGVLLGRLKDRPTFPQRLGGALLGVLNGALFAGFLLRYATAQETDFAATVRATPVANILRDGLPLLFLGLAAAITLLALARSISGLVGRRAAPVPAPSAPTPASASAAAPAPAAGPERRVDERDVLNKVNDATRR
jgi:hypothetical protein